MDTAIDSAIQHLLSLSDAAILKKLRIARQKPENEIETDEEPKSGEELTDEEALQLADMLDKE